MLRFVRLIGLGVSSLLILPLLCLPAGAQDDEEEDIEYNRSAFYLGVAGSFADPHFSFPSKFEIAYGIDLVAGYRSHEFFAIEAEFERIFRFGGDGDARTWATTINVKVPLFPSRRIQPFLKYGIGLLDAEQPRFDFDATDFTMRMGGGVDLYVTDHVMLNTTLDYVRGFGDVRDFRYLSFRLGVSYRF